MLVSRKEKKGQDRRGRDGGNITAAACSRGVLCTVYLYRMSERHGSVRVKECMVIKSGALFPTSRRSFINESVPGFGKSPCCFPPGTTQSTGSVDYPRLGKTCLGYFAAVSPGRLHWVWLDGLVGTQSSQLGPAGGMGPCRVPPSICGTPWLVATSGMPRQTALLVSNSPRPLDAVHTQQHTWNGDGVSSPGVHGYRTYILCAQWKGRVRGAVALQRRQVARPTEAAWLDITRQIGRVGPVALHPFDPPMPRSGFDSLALLPVEGCTPNGQPTAA